MSSDTSPTQCFFEHQLAFNQDVALAAVSDPAATVERAALESSWMQGEDKNLAKLMAGLLSHEGKVARAARGRNLGLVLGRQSERLVRAAVRCNGTALVHAQERFRDDKGVVLEAVKQNGWALRHASEQLRGDREVVLAAVKQNGKALCHASQQLRGDREVVLLAGGGMTA